MDANLMWLASLHPLAPVLNPEQAGILSFPPPGPRAGQEELENDCLLIIHPSLYDPLGT